IAKTAVIRWKGGADYEGRRSVPGGQVVSRDGLKRAMGRLPQQRNRGGFFFPLEIMQLERIDAATDQANLGLLFAVLIGGNPSVNQRLGLVIDPETHAVWSLEDELIFAGFTG